MRFIILPLTQPKKEKKQALIEDTISLAQKVKDEEQQSFILAGVLTAANKFIDVAYAQNIKERMQMLRIIREIVDEAEQKTSVKIAQKLLQRGFSVDAVAEDTGLDIALLRDLQNMKVVH